MNSSEIAKINDEFRKALPIGQVVITQGVAALSPADKAALIQNVIHFKDFNKGNDPYGEHDMGAFTFKAQKFFWKIDYYDSELLYGVDPYEEPESVKRILTIMLANEY